MLLRTDFTPKLIAAATRILSFSPKHLRLVWRNIGRFPAAGVLILALVPVPSLAQSAPPEETPRGVEILLLGTAVGPSVRTDRSEPSSLLIVDGRQYLIDCGIGTIRRLVRADIRSETIETIFITHNHPDHALGLADVMANDYFKMDWGRVRRTINIYGPPQTKDLVDAAFRYISIPFGIFAAGRLHDPEFTNPFEAHEIQHDGLVFQDDKIRVTAAENSHYVLIPAELRVRMKSYSYRFETPHGVIVFTGDTGPSDAVINLAKGADVLVSEVLDLPGMEKSVNDLAESSHWTPESKDAVMAHMKLEHLSWEETGKLASKAQVKSLVLYHHDPNDPAAELAGVKKYFSGPVFSGADLNRYCLGGQTKNGTSDRTLSPCH